MDFTHRSEVIERENLLIPSGFDTPNLIQELVKGMILGPNGETLLYEDVITIPQQTAITGSNRYAKQQNTLVECQEW